LVFLYGITEVARIPLDESDSRFYFTIPLTAFTSGFTMDGEYRVHLIERQRATYDGSLNSNSYVSLFYFTASGIAISSIDKSKILTGPWPL